MALTTYITLIQTNKRSVITRGTNKGVLIFSTRQPCKFMLCFTSVETHSYLNKGRLPFYSSRQIRLHNKLFMASGFNAASIQCLENIDLNLPPISTVNNNLVKLMKYLLNKICQIQKCPYNYWQSHLHFECT